MYKLAKVVVQNSVAIPGVQLKLSVALQKVQNEAPKLTIVGLRGHYILKPPTEHFQHLPENENVTMHLAKLFSIDAVPNSLIKLKSGELSYICKRMDRTEKGDKIHMEDMCQLTERLTEDRYRGSLEQIGKAILKYSTNSGLDALRFFEVVLFSFVTGNSDMHLKNFSLIYKNDEISLAPAYDLVSTRLVISEESDSEEMALTMNGRKSKFNPKDFYAFGEQLKLNKKQIENVFEKFSSNFKAADEMIEKSFLPDNMKEEYKTILVKRYERIELK